MQILNVVYQHQQALQGFYSVNEIELKIGPKPAKWAMDLLENGIRLSFFDYSFIAQKKDQQDNIFSDNNIAICNVAMPHKFKSKSFPKHAILLLYAKSNELYFFDPLPPLMRVVKNNKNYHYLDSLCSGANLVIKTDYFFNAKDNGFYKPHFNKPDCGIYLGFWIIKFNKA